MKIHPISLGSLTAGLVALAIQAWAMPSFASPENSGVYPSGSQFGTDDAPGSIRPVAVNFSGGVAVPVSQDGGSVRGVGTLQSGILDARAGTGALVKLAITPETLQAEGGLVLGFTEPEHVNYFLNRTYDANGRPIIDPEAEKNRPRRAVINHHLLIGPTVGITSEVANPGMQLALGGTLKAQYAVAPIVALYGEANASRRFGVDGKNSTYISGEAGGRVFPFSGGGWYMGVSSILEKRISSHVDGPTGSPKVMITAGVAN